MTFDEAIEIIEYTMKFFPRVWADTNDSGDISRFGTGTETKRSAERMRALLQGHEKENEPTEQTRSEINGWLEMHEQEERDRDDDVW